MNPINYSPTDDPLTVYKYIIENITGKPYPIISLSISQGNFSIEAKV